MQPQRKCQLQPEKFGKHPKTRRTLMLEIVSKIIQALKFAGGVLSFISFAYVFQLVHKAWRYYF